MRVEARSGFLGLHGDEAADFGAAAFGGGELLLNSGQIATHHVFDIARTLAQAVYEIGQRIFAADQHALDFEVQALHGAVHNACHILKAARDRACGFFQTRGEACACYIEAIIQQGGGFGQLRGEVAVGVAHMGGEAAGGIVELGQGSAARILQGAALFFQTREQFHRGATERAGHGRDGGFQILREGKACLIEIIADGGRGVIQPGAESCGSAFHAGRNIVGDAVEHFGGFVEIAAQHAGGGFEAFENGVASRVQSLADFTGNFAQAFDCRAVGFADLLGQAFHRSGKARYRFLCTASEIGGCQCGHALHIRGHGGSGIADAGGDGVGGTRKGIGEARSGIGHALGQAIGHVGHIRDCGFAGLLHAIDQHG